MKHALLLLFALAAPLAAQRALPDSIDAKRDLPYAGTENPKQRLDLFLPKKRADEKPLPVVVFIHGGGWRGGDRAGGARNVEKYVATGKYAGVSIGYRLSGEAKWPAQIHDCKAAIRWIRAHAKEHGLDVEKIGVWGTSAGGQLVSLLGTSGGVKELEGDLGAHVGESSRVSCVVNFCGPQNFHTMLPAGANANADNAITGLFGGSLEAHAAAATAASPVTHVTRDDAPFFTAHGTKDPTVPYAQSIELDAALQKAGVPHVLVAITDGGHGFRGPGLDERIEQFFDLHLRGVKTEISAEPIAAAAGK